MTINVQWIKWKVAAVLTYACTLPPNVHASPTDPVDFITGGSLTYDDNLLRLSSDNQSQVPGRSSRSDMFSTVFAGLRLDKPYSLQRFQLDLTATRYEFRRNTFLSFSALDYRAAWLWSVTPRLTGIVSADRTQALASYADFTNRGNRNVQTNETQRVLADWSVGGAWHLTGGISRLQSNNSAEFTAVGDYVQNSAEGGIRFVSSQDNSATLVRRESWGEYSNRSLGPALLDTGYTQHETEVRAAWRMSGHSTLDARMGYFERRHDHFAQRDYSGAVGSLTGNWNPTGKLKITVTAGRDLLSYQETTVDYSSSYYVSNYARVLPIWTLSDKTALHLKLDINRRDYRGAVTLSPIQQRQDTLRTAQLSMTWQPTEHARIESYLTGEQRSSNTPGFSYHDYIVGLSATLRF